MSILEKKKYETKWNRIKYFKSRFWPRVEGI